MNNHDHDHGFDLSGLLTVLTAIYLLWQYRKQPPARQRWIRVYFAFCVVMTFAYLSASVAIGVWVGGTTLVERSDYPYYCWAAFIAFLYGLWYTVFRAPAKPTNDYIRNHPRSF